MPAERIDREWIAQHGGARRDGHARMQGGSLTWNTVIDRRDGRAIGLGYSDRYYKPKRGDRGGRNVRSWSVDGHAGTIDTLDEALEVLAIQRRGAEPIEAEA